jgi:hypothetical protein
MGVEEFVDVATGIFFVFPSVGVLTMPYCGCVLRMVAG